MNWKLASAAVLVLAFIGTTIGLNTRSGNSTDVANSADAGLRTVRLAGKTITVTVADTPELRASGLSGRSGLASNEGMLFIFNADAKYGFWMKDMRFPIDILWISDKKEVVDMRENVSPSTFPTVFTSNAAARYVLELPAGFTRAYDVKIGDVLRL